MWGVEYRAATQSAASRKINSQMQPGLIDKILVLLQRLIPARLIGGLIYHLARCETVWLKNLLINGFSRLYNVATHEAELAVPDGYASFNDFFTRKLQAGARDLSAQPGAFISPADGTIAQTGIACAGQLLQAKGIEFSAADLLGDTELANELADCHFATIYLAPYNYHRLHMPIAGTLEQTLFIPGLLYSVNARTTAAVPGLYALNERLVCQFNSSAGKFALVLVGAMNVASISTAWDGEILPNSERSVQRKSFSGAAAPQLAQGDYMGHFNMGSTIVMLGPKALTGWLDVPNGTPIQVGQPLGSVVGNQ
jgi:phosphatidylserine decarboxylase